MNTPRTIDAAKDGELRSQLKSKDWLTITARFPSKCKHCGGSIATGNTIAWNKAQSKVMHYNPCAFEWLEAGGTAAPAPATAPVGITLGGKKAAAKPLPSAAKTEPAVPEKSAALKALEEEKAKEKAEEERKAKEEEERKAKEAQSASKPTPAGMTGKENNNAARKPSFARITLRPNNK